MVLLEDNIANACNLIASNEWILSQSNTYVSRMLTSLDFCFLELRAEVTKERFDTEDISV